MGKNQAYKAMQRAKMASAGGPEDIEDGMMDGSFHSPEWHAARLASLQTSHTVTWDEFNKRQKMDRASILGDAVEYLKELLQRINDLRNELETSPERPVLPGSSNFQSLTPTPPALPCRVKEECQIGVSSSGAPPARVEVRTREGRALNIHMFCTRRPGLLLSTMRALDGLGLDVKQAVISCFNGFALDVFRAEQSKEGDIAPEEIKAVLLHTAGCHTAV